MPTWDFEDEDEDRFAEDEDEKGRQILCNVGVNSTFCRNAAPSSGRRPGRRLDSQPVTSTHGAQKCVNQENHE